MLNEKYFGIDNDLCPIENAPITTVTELGGRGEALYTVKTAYTNIEIDGKKDAAYDHGIHLSGLICRTEDREFYKDRPTNLDVYMVRGQDGRLYVFGHVVDPDIFCTEDFFENAVDQCDCIQLLIDKKNIGITMNKLARFLPYEGDKMFPRRQKASKFVITDEGFDFEFAFDNGGEPFAHGDRLGMAFYYYDTNEFVDKTNYKKTVLKLRSELDKTADDFPIPRYYDPDGSLVDSFRFSEDSVSGRFTVEKDAPAPTGDMFTDILNGSVRVAVVGGGKNCAIQTIEAAHKVYKYLSREGANATYIVECVPINTSAYDYEIVFNNTVRKGGNKLWDALSPAEYGMELEGNRVIVSAPIEKSADITVEKIISLFEEAKNGKKITAEDIKLYGRLDGVPFDGIPRPKKVSHITDVGDNAYMYLTLNAEKGDLDYYLAALDEKGWTLYTENTMAKVRTYTYTGYGAVVTVVYSDDCAEGLPSSLRVVVEPAERTNLPMLAPEPYEKKNTPTVTLLNPNNLGMVYKLANGEFLVLDGGCMPQYPTLYKHLVDNSDDGHPVIAAWFFSHFHQDHDGAFVTLVQDDECLKNITVKRIIYNYPQKLVADTALNRDDQANLKKWQSLLDKTGAEIFQARTGQKYYFTDAVLELLWTYEDLLPYNLFCDDTNITCTGYRLTIEGQTHMLLGDTSEDEMRCAYKRMGDYLKSDFVQLAHHGAGSFKSPFELYQFVNADVVFVPGPPARGEAEKWAVANAKETYVRTDGTVTLELPHKAK